MATRKEMRYKPTVYTRGPNGRTYHFQMVAPMTGDGIYEARDDKGNVFHALVPNPDAHEHQALMLTRR